MNSLYGLVSDLTSPLYSEGMQPTLLRDFAKRMGWHPSDRLDVPRLGYLANAHLVVEHGLENTAVITFLKSPHLFSGLTADDREELLNISYNNLVDWHIHVSSGEAAFVYNRSTRSHVVEQQILSPSSLDILRSEAFEQIVGRKPNPNLPALDHALIQTISFWKRRLSAETNGMVTNEDLSAFLNLIMLVRAVEDQRRRMQVTHPAQKRTPSDSTLLSMWDTRRHGTTLGDLLLKSLHKCAQGKIPKFLLPRDRLRSFDSLPQETTSELLRDFYFNKFAPYRYDFSLISKHALSKIYERYVSILRLEETAQATLPTFYQLPVEDLDKAYGSVYTPQFVARFFARFLRDRLPPNIFRKLKTIDPACGSGIFLRTLLEMQCDPVYDTVTSDFVEFSFGNVAGFDIEENACQATRLSLSLLYLVLTGRLPKSLEIYAGESIERFQATPQLQGAFDVVVANPPFVALGAQSPQMRERVATFLGDSGQGRIDLYLAFLRMGLDLLKPGGFGLFVLPHSFLLSQNASGMRRTLAEDAWIHCLADLSTIRVFQDTSTYVVLVVFQKKHADAQIAPPALVIKCQDLVGMALQDAMEGRRLQSSAYSIYDVDQSVFQHDNWLILPPTESKIKSKLDLLPLVSEFLWIREGFATGADDIYIIPKHQIPPGEEAIYAPFLHDREMTRYTVPIDAERYVFYPFHGGQKIEEDALRTMFPRTWRHLCAHRRALEERLSSSEANRAWWEPVRPRLPQNMMRPKIVTPHLALVPRFGLDIQGKYAVSHGPFLYPRDQDAEEELLKFFVAVLNSTPCFWYIASQSHTYSRGYVMLEPKTLKTVPVPDPGSVSLMNRRRLIQLVERRLLSRDTETLEIERDIDRMVAELYGLSTDEYKALIIGD